MAKNRALGVRPTLEANFPVAEYIVSTIALSRFAAVTCFGVPLSQVQFAIEVNRTSPLQARLPSAFRFTINRRLKTSSKPDFGRLKKCGWRLERLGTCSKPHFKRMQLEIINRVDIDKARLRKAFPKIRDGTYAAVHDVSLGNIFYVPDEPRYPSETCIDDLNAIISKPCNEAE